MLDLPTNTTDRLVIRLLERRDLEEARRLHNDDSTLFYLTDVSYVSEAQQEAWFEALSTSRSSRRYVARRRSDDTFVGVFRVDRFDPTNRNAYVGADVVPALRKQGFATEMYEYAWAYILTKRGRRGLRPQRWKRIRQLSGFISVSDSLRRAGNGRLFFAAGASTT